MKYTMKYITLLKNCFSQKHPTVLLGRWNIVYCDKKINKKIDLANEDNCGVCDKIKYDIIDKPVVMNICK